MSIGVEYQGYLRLGGDIRVLVGGRLVGDSKEFGVESSSTLVRLLEKDS